MEEIPNREILLIMGDFNAKIGTTASDDNLRTVIGKYGIGGRNERDNTLLDFCAENDLYITNSNFQHHPRRLYTWQSPDGRYRNQIDYVLVRSRWKTSVRDVKTYPEMDCGSDHNTLVAEICLKFQKPIRRQPKVIRWNSRNEASFASKAIEEIRKIIQDLEIHQRSAQEIWEKTKNVLLETTAACNSNDRPKKPWISQATWDLISNRRTLKS